MIGAAVRRLNLLSRLTISHYSDVFKSLRRISGAKRQSWPRVQADQGQDSERRGGHEQDEFARQPELRSIRRAPRDEHRASTGEAGEGHRGKLPIPVDTRVHEEGHVGARSRGKQGVAPAAECQEGDEQGREQQGEPYGTELGQGLEVEAVRVAGEGAHGAVVSSKASPMGPSSARV